MNIFDEDRSQSLARELRDQYASAEPFPHVVIDDFLPEEVCESVLREFPGPGQIPWRRYKKHYSKKLAAHGDTLCGDHIQDALRQLNSANCLRFLETLTGISGLIPDVHFEGGGLHQIERGGFLKVHLDSNTHPRYRLARRINLLLYLNMDWRDEYRGHLELWDKEMSRCIHKILPIYNRCVIFNTNDISFHGHPDRLECPPGMTRKSIAVYYYTEGRPATDSDRDHGTIWRDRPGTRLDSSAYQSAWRRVVTTVKAPQHLFSRVTRGRGELHTPRSERTM
jgi:Rps23 Pro-64 3,4-dihydroxylase Tpa1-like proline 4-hydroxylase